MSNFAKYQIQVFIWDGPVHNTMEKSKLTIVIDKTSTVYEWGHFIFM